MTPGSRIAIFLMLSLGMLLFAPAARSGVLGKADIERYFPDAIRVLDRDRDVPVWPIVKLDGPRETVVAYVFESIDLAPVPGFAGEPFNLLVALDRQGEFMEVRVLSQHEPVFLDGLGPEPLFRFVEQYRGRRLADGLRVVAPRRLASGGRDAATLDGVTKATASVRIVNETVLAAALKVARAKLGFALGGEVARVRADAFEALSFAELEKRSWVQHRRIDPQEIERAFADADLAQAPQSDATEFFAAYLNAPSIGRNLLGDAGWKALEARLEPGQHALLVHARGPASFVDDTFQRGAVPEHLALHQNRLAIELRDLDLDLPQWPAGLDKGGDLKIFRLAAASGFDPGAPWDLALRVTRRKGQLFGEAVTREFPLAMQLPERLLIRPSAAESGAWKSIWVSRVPDLALLGVMLIALVAMLYALPRKLLARRTLTVLRLGFLALTLGAIGWHAQGQVSIVQIVGAVKSFLAGKGLGFLLYDPITCVLLAFTLITLFVWGRGTFCGWLCPFGALQEFLALLARKLRLPQWRMPDLIDRRLALLKYLLLAAILSSAVALPSIAEALVEAEPFKTAITLAFQRAGWPLAYTLATLALGLFVFKAYCRWLCPLGALLAVGGALRRWNWLARRADCGQPCQICRKHCEYRAIEASGAIRYRDCFQCLDCVSIYHDRLRCAPLRLADRRAARQTVNGKNGGAS